MRVWERPFRFRFDRFGLTKSDFRFSVLTLLREWLCQAELTDWLWFEFRNPFRNLQSVCEFVCFGFIFSFVEAIMRERLSHFRFGWFEIRKSVFLVSFFEVEVNVERLFPLALTDSDSSFEMPFFSNVSLAWRFCDSDYLALILIRVLEVHVSIFTILFRSKLVWERLCLLRFWILRSGSSFGTRF